MDRSAHDDIRLLGIRDQPLSVDEAIEAVRDPTCGGLAVFVGTVRDHDESRGVVSLDYSAHPAALDRLAEVAADVADRHPGVLLAAIHRVGALAIGDLAVVVAVGAAHRGEALDTCRDLIDTLKEEVPIWKHQRFTDGATEWVGMP